MCLCIHRMCTHCMMMPAVCWVGYNLVKAATYSSSRVLVVMVSIPRGFCASLCSPAVTPQVSAQGKYGMAVGYCRRCALRALV